MKRILRSLHGNRALALTWVAVLVAVHPVLFLAAALPSIWLFVPVMALAYVAEHQAARRAPLLLSWLGKVQLTVTGRYVARDAALLIFVAASDGAGLVPLSVGMVGLHGIRAGIIGLRTYVTKRRTLPIATRNVDLSELRIPDAPPRLLMRGGVRRPLYLTLPVIAATLAGFWWVGLAIGAMVGLVALAVLGSHALRVRHLADRAWVKRTIHERVLEYHPEVALYYSSGQPDTVYQVNMWLGPLARLNRRPIVLIREREHLARIARTSIPVVCLTGGSDVMDFELPDLRVALYTGNVGKNIHLLRNAAVKHVFVGHGDSDKLASFNPASKVYDEVWVAGPAGRDRYRRARVGVRDESIVEVGRPQLSEVSPGPTGNRMFTVLYAPTWEGWSSDMLLSSLHVLGERLVTDLIARPDLRVIYKPHPLTGIRNSQVRAAHRTIVRLLRSATEADPAMKARMSELDSRARELRAVRKGADAAERARDSAPVDAAVQAELDQIEVEWQAAYWIAAGGLHQTVQGTRPDLYSCFNQADLMISDISSVVSDFVASGKPYVVTNLADLPAAEFRAAQTAAGGAYLLGSECLELEQILAAVRGPAPDPLAADRLVVREYLLGPAEPDATARFDAAVDRLSRQRDQELALLVPMAG